MHKCSMYIYVHLDVNTVLWSPFRFMTTHGNEKLFYNSVVWVLRETVLENIICYKRLRGHIFIQLSVFLLFSDVKISQSVRKNQNMSVFHINWYKTCWNIKTKVWKLKIAFKLFYYHCLEWYGQTMFMLVTVSVLNMFKQF